MDHSVDDSIGHSIDDLTDYDYDYDYEYEYEYDCDCD
jgi:hypothetical protein